VIGRSTVLPMIAASGWSTVPRVPYPKRLGQTQTATPHGASRLGRIGELAGDRDDSRAVSQIADRGGLAAFCATNGPGKVHLTTWGRWRSEHFPQSSSPCPVPRSPPSAGTATCWGQPGHRAASPRRLELRRPRPWRAAVGERVRAGCASWQACTRSPTSSGRFATIMSRSTEAALVISN